MNTRKRARKDATTDRVRSHYDPAFEQIQMRAYEIYIQRGRQDGLDLEDWFQAEEELKTSGHNLGRMIGKVERLREIRGKHGNRNR